MCLCIFFGLLVSLISPTSVFHPCLCGAVFFLPCFCLHLPLNAKECINSMFVLHCSSCHPAFCRRRAADSRFQHPTAAAVLISCPAQWPQETTRSYFYVKERRITGYYRRIGQNQTTLKQATQKNICVLACSQNVMNMPQVQ